MQAAWTYLTENLDHGGESPDHLPVIAIIDSGVDRTHPDFSGTSFDCPVAIEETGPCPDDCETLALLDEPWDDYGHGTHVTGIAVAAAGGDAAPLKPCIRTIKAFGLGGVDPGSLVSEAVVHAVCQGAAVINMSFSTEYESELVRDMFLWASNRAVLIASVGNVGQDRCLHPFYPAHYPFVLGVEALGHGGSRAHWSNHGYECRMPGTCIRGAVPGDDHVTWSGTSMSAPYASALAAMVSAMNRRLAPHQVFHILSRASGALEALEMAKNHETDRGSFSEAYPPCPPVKEIEHCECVPVRPAAYEASQRIDNPGCRYDVEAVYIDGCRLGPALEVSQGEHVLTICFTERMNTAIPPLISLGRPPHYCDLYICPHQGHWKNAIVYEARFELTYDLSMGFNGLFIRRAWTCAGRQMLAYGQGGFIIPDGTSPAATTSGDGGGLPDQGSHLLCGEDICADHRQKIYMVCNLYLAFYPNGPYFKVNEHPVRQTIPDPGGLALRLPDRVRLANEEDCSRLYLKIVPVNPDLRTRAIFHDVQLKDDGDRTNRELLNIFLDRDWNTERLFA